MLIFDAVRECKNVSAGWRVRSCDCKILVAIFSLLFLTTSYAQTERETVDFNIPSLALPQALNEFARQARVELVFAERGFDSVRTTAVVGSFQRERALELLLAGTGLRVGFGSGDSVIVQRTDTVETTTGLTIGDTGSATVLLAQTAVDTLQNSDGFVSVENRTRQIAARVVEPQAVEEILVTGSRIRGAQNVSPVMTITRQDIDDSGFATVEELVEKLPQNFGSGASLDNTNSTNKFQAVGGITRDFAGGSSVNLRGLGASSTLVLLNGRRMSPGGQEARFTNISSIPVTAIERVEVMTDGASAIYGSDAIGGVVNFILREDYDGAETRLRYGSDVRGGTSNTQVAQSFGNSWQDGNVLFTYEYYKSDNLASKDRKYTASNDLSVFGGTDWRQPGGSPANIRIGGLSGDYYAIPFGQDGTSLISADFSLSTPRHFYNDRALRDTIPALERHSAFLHLTQNIGTVGLFAQARFSNEDNELLNNGTIFDFNVPGDDPMTPEIEGNPFFVDPTGSGLTSVRVDNYWLIDEFGQSVGFGEVDSSGVTLGAQFDFGDKWRGEMVGNWSKEEATSGVSGEPDLVALAAAVNQTDPNLAFNPFGEGSNTNPDVLEAILDRSKTVQFVSENELWSVNFGMTGDAFDIAGGTVKVATGIDFREESLLGVSNNSEISNVSDLNRDVLAVYAEVFVPVVGDANSRAGLQRFELSLAARYEDYSDFGSSTNPKLGILWSPTKSLTFRGTLGTSYRAPALADLNDTDLRSNPIGYLPQFFANIGLIPYPVLFRGGGNSSLQAEEATTWTAGFRWDPSRVEGLTLDITYFNVDFTDRIELPTSNLIDAVNNPRFASLVNTNPTDEQIFTLASDPRYNPDEIPGFPTPAADILSGSALVGAIVDLRVTNLAQSVVTGSEVQLSYNFDTALGSFAVGLNGSYMFDFERRFIAPDPLIEEVDTLGRPVDFRARANVTWSSDAWVVAGHANYTDGYTDQFSNPARAVDSWTTVDLTIAYDTGEHKGFLGGTRLSLSIQNLFNEDPPFVDTFGGVAYDATNASPLGQFISLQMTKNW